MSKRIPSPAARCIASKPSLGGVFARMPRGSGWGGGYKRTPPKGEHKCLSRDAMNKLIAQLG